MINEELKNQIKNANDIVDVIIEYQKLIKAGANYKGVCPFHEDTSPSMMVSKSKQIYKCFACGAGGDVIKYVMEVEKITFYDAMKKLAQRVNIVIPESEDPAERQKTMEREKLFSKNNLDQATFLGNRNDKEFLDYIEERQFSIETVKKFGLGYAKEGRFYNRITYPFYSSSNKIVGHTGRALNWDKASKYPKYLNSNEDIIFHKNSLLFGIQQAKKAISDSGNAYFVEGQNDVISMSQAGIENVVCGSGTALSERQIQYLNRFTDKITFVYDGDDAGVKAMYRSIKVALPLNTNLFVINLPNGQDPDDFVKDTTNLDKLPNLLNNMEKKWWDIISSKFPYDHQNPEQNLANLKEVCSYVELIKEDAIFKSYLTLVAEQFHCSISDIKKQISGQKKSTVVASSGCQGIEEAVKLMKENREIELTFNMDKFIEQMEESPIILWQGESNKSSFQVIRKEFNLLTVDLSLTAITEDQIDLLQKMYCFKIAINVNAINEDDAEEDSENEQIPETGNFANWYLRHNNHKGYYETTCKNRETYIKKSIDVISKSGDLNIEISMNEYSKLLGLGSRTLTKLIGKAKDSGNNKSFNQDNQSIEQKALVFNMNEIPSYVEDNKDYNRIYNNFGFYPLINKNKEPISYVFKLQKSGGFETVSDFYMEPLLHIYSKKEENNQRIIKLNHIHFKPRYVSWPSNNFAQLNKIQERLIAEGAYNFTGDPLQFKRIWNNMSYGFKTCSELNVFGQQPEGFWAFTNAIFHNVNGVDQVDFVDEMGVVEHKDQNFYSPAFSKIHVGDRQDEEEYREDRYYMYKVPENPQDKLSFKQWAELFHEVYKIEDNGEWGILFSIITAFREWIYNQQRFFTTLFYIGPTSSGKSQVAESIRSLFCDPTAPKFNLNSGTRAAFFQNLARNRNVPVIMEEYNDQDIDPGFFQALKSAIYDGEGRAKMAGKETKKIENTPINAVPILLGQEAPQGDDGALANRVIICEVPYPENGSFSNRQVEVYDKLKYHQKMGLSNVLVEILAIRPVVMQYYNEVFKKELRKLKDTINIAATNTEGLTRITNAVCMNTTMCYIIENYTKLELPFTYNDFFTVACNKIHKQMKSLSSTNKLTNFFETIDFLITQNSIMYGREYKIEHPQSNKISLYNNNGNKEEITIPEDVKVLHLQLTQLYPLYYKTMGKKALNLLTLKNYFNSNRAFIGWSKSTRFTFFVEKEQPNESLDAHGVTVYNKAFAMEKKSSVTSSFAFNYNMLREQLDIDYERNANEEEVIPNIPEKKNTEIPF